MPPIIIYHDFCHDGITALWVAQHAFGHIEVIPGRFDDRPDLDYLKDREVYFLDFTWHRDVMESVYAVARTVYVFDHHLSAMNELSDMEGTTFDMTRSGAGLAWDILVGGPRPDLIDYVEDRDLERFALPYSREVHLACTAQPLDLITREVLMYTPIETLIDRGRIIKPYHDRLVEEAIASARRETLGLWSVPVVHTPNIDIAVDACLQLARGEPFAAAVRDRSNGTQLYSLRSSPEGINVGTLAKTFGGGGHFHCSGFIRNGKAISH